MISTKSFSLSDLSPKIVVLDLIALAVITLVPAISHMLSLPIYLLEPMRIMLVLSIAHTSKKNSFLIAIALPLFSLLISFHPSFFKMFLMISELLLNVWLFFYLSSRLKNDFAALFTSITLSKLYYYGVKFLLINFGLLEGELVTTPIYLQTIVAVVLSIYVYFIFSKNRKENVQ